MADIPPPERKTIAYTSGRIVMPDSTGISLIDDPRGDVVALLHLAGPRVDGTYCDEVIAIHGPGAIGLIAQLRVAAIERYSVELVDEMVEKAIEAIRA
jgi:hypothetical protein